MLMPHTSKTMPWVLIDPKVYGPQAWHVLVLSGRGWRIWHPTVVRDKAAG